MAPESFVHNNLSSRYCQHLLDHRESEGIPEKTSTSLTVWITTNCGKFLEMGIPDHISCLLRNLYVSEEATVRTRHGTKDWFKIGKEVQQGCIWSACLLNLYAEYTMQNAGLNESQAGIMIARRNINNLKHADDTLTLTSL